MLRLVEERDDDRHAQRPCHHPDPGDAEPVESRQLAWPRGAGAGGAGRAARTDVPQARRAAHGGPRRRPTRRGSSGFPAAEARRAPAARPRRPRAEDARRSSTRSDPNAGSRGAVRRGRPSAGGAGGRRPGISKLCVRQPRSRARTTSIVSQPSRRGAARCPASTRAGRTWSRPRHGPRGSRWRTGRPAASGALRNAPASPSVGSLRKAVSSVSSVAGVSRRSPSTLRHDVPARVEPVHPPCEGLSADPPASRSGPRGRVGRRGHRGPRRARRLNASAIAPESSVEPSSTSSSRSGRRVCASSEDSSSPR